MNGTAGFVSCSRVLGGWCIHIKNGTEVYLSAALSTGSKFYSFTSLALASVPLLKRIVSMYTPLA